MSRNLGSGNNGIICGTMTCVNQNWISSRKVNAKCDQGQVLRKTRQNQTLTLSTNLCGIHTCWARQDIERVNMRESCDYFGNRCSSNDYYINRFWNLRVYIYIYIYIYIYTVDISYTRCILIKCNYFPPRYSETCTQLYMFNYVLTCVYTVYSFFDHTYIHICIYIYIYLFIYLYMYIYIYTYTAILM